MVVLVVVVNKVHPASPKRRTPHSAEPALLPNLNVNHLCNLCLATLLYDLVSVLLQR